jgi:integrase/recombinase XerD
MSTPVVTIFVRHAKECPYKGGRVFQALPPQKASALERKWQAVSPVRQSPLVGRSWDIQAKTRTAVQTPPASAAHPPPSTKTLEQAIELFIDFKTAEGLDSNLLKTYTRELERLRQFMDKRMAFHVADISLELLTEYRATWNEQYPSSTTRQKVQDRLRAFLRYCYEARWIDRVPGLSPIQVDEPPTMPLTDQEYENLLARCLKEFHPEKAKKVRALIQCMRHSGLSIRDAVPLQRDEIQWDSKKKVHRIVTSRQKSGVHVSVPIPPEVA